MGVGVEGVGVEGTSTTTGTGVDGDEGVEDVGVEGGDPPAVQALTIIVMAVVSCSP